MKSCEISSARIIHFICILVRNFAQSTRVTMLCQVQNVKTIWQVMNTLCANKFYGNASLRYIQDAWWRHQMETISAWLAFTDDWWIPRRNASDAELWYFLWSAPKQTVSKQSRHRWFETPSPSLWRHCNVDMLYCNVPWWIEPSKLLYTSIGLSRMTQKIVFLWKMIWNNTYNYKHNHDHSNVCTPPSESFECYVSYLEEVFFYCFLVFIRFFSHYTSFPLICPLTDFTLK